MFYKSKVVGRTFHKIKNEVTEGDYLILVAEEDNAYDPDAIAVYNKENELTGYIANSSETLSVNNVRNGNLSATVLKYLLNFSDMSYFAEVVSSHSSCIYVLINEVDCLYK